MKWLKTLEIRRLFIHPRSPWQTGYSDYITPRCIYTSGVLQRKVYRKWANLRMNDLSVSIAPNKNIKKFSICFICAAILGAILHWRVFDGVVVVMGLILITTRPLPLRALKTAFSETKLFHSLLGGWILIILIGYILSGTPMEVFNFRWLFGAYIIYLYARCISQGERSLVLSISSVLLLGSVSAFIYWYKVAGAFPSNSNRFQGFYKNPNIYGMTMSLLISFFFAWILSGIYYKRKFSWIEGMAFLIGLSGVFLTYSRSSWLGFFIGSLMTCLLLRHNKKILLSYCSLTVTVLLFFLKDFLGFRERILHTTDVGGLNANAIRLEIWKANLAMFLDHPFFGVGYWHNTSLLHKYTTVEKVSGSDIQAHAHNQFLQVLSGTGAIGSLFYLALVITICTYFYRQFYSAKTITAKRFALGALIAFISFLFTSLTDSPLDSRETRAMLMIILATSLGVIHSESNPTGRVPNC